ncbi:hypothetical protein [Devosia sp. SL43]|uniref:hypothetical protein n=1 Tax=Devosia sp. SL43 TaxID=2806348 RepID=UPI001F40D170|nr:hypothetical protein [Devosia sp. SL43]UJW87154.1 hypothetical protein IM737_07910 [Devosia sp. SL43]
MRAGLAVIAALALSVTPVVAQGKTKGTAMSLDVGVEVVELCEEFAKGDVLAVDDAIAKGWDAYEGTGESPYVQTYSASKELAGIGSAEIFVLFEDYPTHTLGYCRMDVLEPQGNDGSVVIQAIQNLDRYEGQTQMISEGSFASLVGADDDTNRMLLTHWSAESFVVQLTIITPKPASTE